ncbi:CorA metal ion transporter [Basidiobolus ranarum]|uniref:CorA metal ion transporter n=1 Tax=Basidiobolus ranarum TaxID=34480 RepID=A0ABR2WXV4_9FUNG
MHGYARSNSSFTLGSQSEHTLHLNGSAYTQQELYRDDLEYIQKQDICFPIIAPKDDSYFDSESLNEYLTTGQHQAHNHTNKSFTELDSQSCHDNQIRFFSPERGSITANSLSGLASEKHTLADLFGQDMYWIDFLNPSYNELKWIGKIFHIHPLTIEDIQGAESREKFESFRNYYFVSVQAFNSNQHSDSNIHDLDNPISVYNVVMKHCILTFHYLPIYHCDKVLTRYARLRDYLVLTPDWINYALMDSIVDDFIPLEDNLELEADSIDELVFILKESEQADMLRRIGQARKNLSGLLGILKPKADVVKAVIKRITALKSEATNDIGLYLGDVQGNFSFVNSI